MITVAAVEPSSSVETVRTAMALLELLARSTWAGIVAANLVRISDGFATHYVRLDALRDLAASLVKPQTMNVPHCGYSGPT